MVILGSTYGSDGGGCYRTSDFSMLIERPKFLEAVANKSVRRCKSVSECDIRAVSSAKRSSRTKSSCVWVFAFSRCKLNVLPLILNRMKTPIREVPKASFKTALRYKAKRSGARTQPCFTQMLMLNGLVSSPSTSNLPCILS